MKKRQLVSITISIFWWLIIAMILNLINDRNYSEWEILFTWAVYSFVITPIGLWITFLPNVKDAIKTSPMFKFFIFILIILTLLPLISIFLNK